MGWEVMGGFHLRCVPFSFIDVNEHTREEKHVTQTWMTPPTPPPPFQKKIK